MAGLGYYGDYLVSLEGALIADSSDVSWATETADSTVVTQFGFAGITPHGSMTRFSVSCFDPFSGSMLGTVQGYQDTRAKVKLAIIQTSTGKKMATEVFIQNVKGSSGVGSNASFSFDAIGGEAAFV